MTDQTSVPLWLRDEGRWVDRRSNVLAKRHGLRKSLAETLAWSELGYSSSGIAGQADTTASTVKSHFAEIAATIDENALLAKKPAQISVSAPAVPNEVSDR